MSNTVSVNWGNTDVNCHFTSFHIGFTTFHFISRDFTSVSQHFTSVLRHFTSVSRHFKSVSHLCNIIFMSFHFIFTSHTLIHLLSFMFKVKVDMLFKSDRCIFSIYFLYKMQITYLGLIFDHTLLKVQKDVSWLLHGQFRGGYTPDDPSKTVSTR